MSEPDGKSAQLLDAALGCFARYGYRRTSMETIAQAAGVSRPALYQHFTGKEGVFRALVGRLLDSVLATAQAAAQAAGPTEDRLYAVLAAKPELVTGHTAHSAYQGELIAEAAVIAADLFEDFRGRLVAIVDDLLAAADDLDLSAGGLSSRDAAVLLFDAVVGIEHAQVPVEELHTRLRQLVTLAIRGLSAEED